MLDQQDTKSFMLMELSIDNKKKKGKGKEEI